VQTVWQALQGAGKAARGHGRGGAPVRRQSRLRGREGPFWRPFNPKDAARYMTAAERYERITRAKGQRSGKLGPVALEVLRELLRLIDYRTGRLEPSIATLCDRLRRSRDAVTRGLSALKAAGFVDWLRRYEPTDNEGERGPQVKQASNAYRLTLPALAEKLLGRLWQAPPRPEDDTHRREAREAEVKAMIETLPLWEQPAQIVDDPQLAAVLSRLGRAVAERESAKRTESGQRFI
jgi:hypothetical protein